MSSHLPALPVDAWAGILAFAPGHLYIVGCVCRAWNAQASRPEEPRQISPRTILEQQGDPEWLIFAASAWWSELEANALLSAAAQEADQGVMKLARAWGADDFDEAFARAAGKGRLEAMERLKRWGARNFSAALNRAAASEQLRAMHWIKTLGLSDLHPSKLWTLTDLTNALICAAQEGRLRAMEFLIRWGWGRTPAREDLNAPLVAAARKGHLKAMKLLKEWGAKGFGVALIGAAGSGQQEAIRLILHEKGWGGVVDLNTPLARAAENGHLGAMELLVWPNGKSGPKGATDLNRALNWAAQAGRLGAMERLKAWGATDLVTALMWAARGGQLEAMRLLVSSGWGAANFADALAWAAGSDQLEAMELLSSLEVWDVNDLDSALRVATLGGHPQAVALLEKWKSE